MMALLILIGFGLLFFILLPAGLIYLWLSTFNKKAIILNEVGEDENDAIIKYVKCKTVQDKSTGGMIKFHPFSGLRPSKQFDSHFWTTIKDKKKLREGIVLYRQGENYRPVVMHSQNDQYCLDILDEDNRKFRMVYEISQSKKNRDMGIVTPAVISFFVFACFFTLVMVIGVIWIMDENTKTFFISQGYQVVAG